MKPKKLSHYYSIVPGCSTSISYASPVRTCEATGVLPDDSYGSVVGGKMPNREERRDALLSVPYSVRNATIGLTRVARRAGTKHDSAATNVSSPATAK